MPQSQASRESKRRYDQSARGQERKRARRQDPAYKARAYMRARATIKRRVAWVQAYKLSKGCCDCGYNDHAEALDFDHRPEHKKEFQIARAMTLSMERLMVEIEKCDVVCANCHRVRTHRRRAGNV